MTKQFSDFGIEAPKAKFTGDKIKMNYILDKKVKVLDYMIEPSKFKEGKAMCLRLWLDVDNTKRILFTGSVSLMRQIENIPAGQAFETVIVKKEEQFLFT